MPPELAAFLPLFAGLTITLLGLAWCSRQISLRIQTVIYYATHSVELPTVVLFLIFMPGVFIHESAHWLTAKLLGLKTGKFRVWPQRRGNSIGMGSVSVQQGGAWRDSLVGMSPLVVGSVIVGLISHRVFGAYTLAEAVTAGDWRGAAVSFREALQTTDGAVWAYLLFVIANAMMPSPSDREPLLPVLLYVLAAAALYFVIGLPLTPVTSALNWLAPTIQDLTSAFLFVIVLDLLVLSLLLLVELLIAPARR